MKHYRVLMQDFVNGESFSFAITYKARNANSALDMAEFEWGHRIKVIGIKLV